MFIHTTMIFFASGFADRPIDCKFLHIFLRTLHGFPLHLSMDIACPTHQDQPTIIAYAQQVGRLRSLEDADDVSGLGFRRYPTDATVLRDTESPGTCPLQDRVFVQVHAIEGLLAWLTGYFVRRRRSRVISTFYPPRFQPLHVADVLLEIPAIR